MEVSRRCHAYKTSDIDVKVFSKTVHMFSSRLGFNLKKKKSPTMKFWTKFSHTFGRDGNGMLKIIWFWSSTAFEVLGQVSEECDTEEVSIRPMTSI